MTKFGSGGSLMPKTFSGFNFGNNQFQNIGQGLPIKNFVSIPKKT